MKSLTLTLILSLSVLVALGGCKKDSPKTEGGDSGATDTATNAVNDTAKAAEEKAHTHADGTTHTHGDEQGHEHGGHSHDPANTIKLLPVVVDGMKIECSQEHGKVKAGEEAALMIKLPYSDKGSSVVRVWLGGPDRTKHMVAKAIYAPSHDDYDVHVMPPADLNMTTMWWFEITKPDGTKHLGSAKPAM